jgi:hypothetical protein
VERARDASFATMLSFERTEIPMGPEPAGAPVARVELLVTDQGNGLLVDIPD